MRLRLLTAWLSQHSPINLSAKGLELLLRSVSKVKRQIKPYLRIDGILMTMVMPRTNISKKIMETVKSAYGQRIKVFDTLISYSIHAVETTAEGKSIFAYDKGGKVAAAYEHFGKKAAELVDSIKRSGVMAPATVRLIWSSKVGQSIFRGGGLLLCERVDL